MTGQSWQMLGASAGGHLTQLDVVTSAHIERMVSTGAGIAVLFLLRAARCNIPAEYVESATPVDGRPSLSGRILERVDKVRCASQWPWTRAGWESAPDPGGGGPRACAQSALPDAMDPPAVIAARDEPGAAPDAQASARPPSRPVRGRGGRRVISGAALAVLTLLVGRTRDLVGLRRACRGAGTLLAMVASTSVDEYRSMA